MRYNCADSLDRTNVSSFFGAIQVRGREGLFEGFPHDAVLLLRKRLFDMHVAATARRFWVAQHMSDTCGCAL